MVKKLEKLGNIYDQKKYDFEEEVCNNEIFREDIKTVKAESSDNQAQLDVISKELELKTAIIKLQGKTKLQMRLDQQ